MGGEINSPHLEKNPKDGKNSIYRYGTNIIQGWKKSLEVFNICNTINISENKTIDIFGIFDGHSGNSIAQYISENFCNELSKNGNFIIQEYKQAIIETFVKIDKSLRKKEINDVLENYSLKSKYKLTKDNNNDLDEEDLNRINTLMDIINPDNLEDVLISDYVGSSGIIILLTGNITYIANAGNSHFIIINKNFEINNKIIEKQKNYEEEEKNRIKIIKGLKYGKNIINEDYSYTRGFGDYQYKTNDFIKIDSQEILAEPFIYEINQSDIKYIIVFNNGFYENFQNMNMSEKDIDNKEIIYKNIADYFLQYLKDDQKAISEIISDYFNKYIPNDLNQINDNNKNSQVNSNNLSCIIVDFLHNNNNILIYFIILFFSTYIYISI